MGVKNLWPVLSGAGELSNLEELRGRRVAVDLAGWIVQNSQVRAMNGKVVKPHLRNLFFRTLALLSLDMKPIFVLDGVAPELKKETLAARQAAQDKGSVEGSQSNCGLGRHRLKALMGECRILLKALGLQCVQSQGEAEALCARLNSAGLVDAVITEDSDAFCYGAITVLKNFSVSASSHTAQVFCMDRIQRLLGLSRDRVIFMAILLGCDFFPTGVPGIGKELIGQLFSLWPQHWNCVEALRIWIRSRFSHEVQCAKMSALVCSECQLSVHCFACRDWMDAVSNGDCHCRLLADQSDMRKVENAIKKRCQAVDASFWEKDFPQIVEEFRFEDATDVESWKTCPITMPDFDLVVDILVKKLAWLEDYCVEKLLPVLTHWQLRQSSESTLSRVPPVIQPTSLLKKRVRNGSRCYEIEWQTTSSNPFKQIPSNFSTCEEVARFELAFPELAAQFKAQTEKAKMPKQRKARMKPSVQSQQLTVPQMFAKSMVPYPEDVMEQLTQSFADVSMASIARTDLSIDVSDLSLIIDDFMATKIPTQLSPTTALLTSTPKHPPRTHLPHSANLSRQADVSLGDETEDSFDRMCK